MRKMYKIGEKSVTLTNALIEKYKCLSGKALNPKGRQVSKRVRPGKVGWVR
jgi:hypothetical protein